MWALGDYDRIAARLAPAAERIASKVGDGAGRRAVDVAAGTGSLARALASRSWSVAACDIAPALVERGRELSADAGLDIDWHEAELDELPFADGSAELFGSSFGLIFAPDAERALAEAHRLLRAGGTLAFSAWTPSSYMAEMTTVMSEFMPPNPEMRKPFRWGDLELTNSWLAGGFTSISTTTHTLPWVFPTASAAADFKFTYSPPHLAALSFVGERADELRAAVRDHLAGLAARDGSIKIDAEYVVTVARRK
jgi:ubiquinone/menaquinone biosynthesis C-methylase UbiE